MKANATTTPWMLTLTSDLQLLGVVRAFVGAACAAAGLDPKATDAVVLAASEAANNVIRHAHRGLPDAQLQVRCEATSDGFEVTLLDEGQPFDLDAVPRLDPSELRVGGRGVFLMRKLMDEVCCRPRSGRGNVLRMLKRWSRQSASKSVCATAP